jgi:UDP-N-acetylglucosamine 1-carboxyvinyltransferase
MDRFVIDGGTPLRGRVAVSGAKNAALPIMAASILADGCTRLENVPELVDVQTLSYLLRSLGLRVERGASDGEAGQTDGRPLELEVHDSGPVVAEYDLVRRMRASICVLGPLLARRGEAIVSLPGGCNIGDRPVDLHLKGLAALGAEIDIRKGYIHARARRLRGAAVYLGGPFGSTVTGTCNVLSAAVLAEGRTTIEAAACEPEVVDLGEYLNKMGARISGLGTPFLAIDGVERLNGASHRVIPDRIEAGTLLMATAITGGDVTITGACEKHLTAVIEKLREIGVRIERVSAAATDGLCGGADADDLRVTVADRIGSADCVMLPYPGLPTDLQAQLMALLTVSDGLSVVTDRVFPDRFLHAAELARMGAKIRREGPTAIVCGTRQLSGAAVMASDLRASAALVLAGMAAEGETIVRRIYHLDRGYDGLEKKLNALGARIRRVQDDPANIPASLVVGAPTVPVHQLDGPKWLKVRQPRGEVRAGDG